MKIRLLYPFLCLLLSACAEDEVPAPEPEPEPTDFCYLQEQMTITGNDTSSITYSYNDQNQVIETVHKEQGELVATHTYAYSSEGQLIREELFEPDQQEPVHHILYSYSAEGRLSKYEVQVPLSLGVFHNLSAFKATYNPNGSLRSTAYYLYRNNELKTERGYAFYYIKDKPPSVTYTAGDTALNYTATYAFDEARAPLSAVPAFYIREPGIGYPGKQNLTEFNASRGGKEVKNLSYEAVYSYNERGYPTKAVITYMDETVTTIDYTYTCI